MLISELVGIASAATLMALGMVSTAAPMLRRRSSEQLLRLFGVCVFAYGLRLMLQQPPIGDGFDDDVTLVVVRCDG